MFKNHSLDVKLDTDNVTVNHDINVSTLAFIRTHRLIQDAGKTAIAVIAAAALAKTTSEIAIHIAKTTIK